MKSRSQELLDKSISAMIAAIEIYNKPDFRYREESFSILSINGWELLLKAKWLKENKNKINSLYITEKKKNKNGDFSKRVLIKATDCGNPLTHSLDYLAKQLVIKKMLNEIVKDNLNALKEIRDSSVHFYHKNPIFSLRIQEVGSASLKNYVHILKEWFDVDMSGYNFYLMPLAFLSFNKEHDAIVLNKEEQNLVKFISSLEAANDPDENYSISVNVDISFSKGKASEALSVQLSNDESATKIQLTRKQFKDKYPLTYKALNDRCRKRYSDFKLNKDYQQLRKKFVGNTKYSTTEKLDEDNPNTPKQTWYSEAIFAEFDKVYTKII